MKKFMAILFSTLLVCSLIFSSFVATVSASEISDVNKANNSADSLKEKFDPYVEVQNNRYVLNLPKDIQFTSSEITQANQSIQMANQQLEENYGSIDPGTKIAIYPSLRADSYTRDDFWWGSRYYFRSNAAVAKMLHELDTQSIIYAAGGALAALFSAGISAAAGIIGAAYAQKMKSDLEYMNNIHLHDYLNMDVNFTGYYTIYVP